MNKLHKIKTKSITLIAVIKALVYRCCGVQFPPRATETSPHGPHSHGGGVCFFYVGTV